MVQSYKLQWTRKHFSHDISLMIQALQLHQPKIIAIDTETTGLNIMKDVPFLVIISWMKNETEGIVCSFDFSAHNMNLVYEEMLKARWIVGQNIKYDFHILRNGGAPFPFHRLRRDEQWISDTKIAARLLQHTDSLFGFRLKEMSIRYIDSNAGHEEKEVKIIRDQISKSNKRILDISLKSIGWSLSKINVFVAKGKRLHYELPADVYAIYSKWLVEIGPGTYRDIYQKNPVRMINYAQNDAVFTLELFLRFSEELQKIGEEKLITLFKQECNLIEIYHKQEEIGVSVDWKYLVESKERVINFMEMKQQRLDALIGKPFNASSSAQFLKLATSLKYNVPHSFFQITVRTRIGEVVKESADKDSIKKIIELGGELGHIASLILDIRKGLKLLTNNITKIMEAVISTGDGKYHPLSDQAGTLTGRISGTMQQMPREGTFTSDNIELFNARKAIIPTGGKFSTLIFQDFDQMEGRVQAHFTTLSKTPDENLLSVFIPWEKKHYLTFETYEPFNPQHRDMINDKQPDGISSVWVGKDYITPWVGKDFHGMHVETAFNIDSTHPDWKKYRNAAKTINFAVNYGSSLNGLLNNKDLEAFSPEVIQSIHSAAQQNFKGVAGCKRWILNKCTREGRIFNIYGRMYRMENIDRYGYMLNNYMVQGSCADMLKEALIKIDRFLKDNNANSRVLYTIHDELMWELYDGEESIIEQINYILKSSSSWSVVPLTCGIEYSKTNWFEKKEI